MLKKCKICLDKGGTVNEIGYFSAGNMQNCNTFEFPIINGKSPNTFNINLSGEGNYIYFIVEELGGIPDPNYFSDTPTVLPEIISDEPTEQEEK